MHFPIWFLALFSKAKSFQGNPVIGNAYVKRCAKFRRLFLKSSSWHPAGQG